MYEICFVLNPWFPKKLMGTKYLRGCSHITEFHHQGATRWTGAMMNLCVNVRCAQLMAWTGTPSVCVEITYQQRDPKGMNSTRILQHLFSGLAYTHTHRATCASHTYNTPCLMAMKLKRETLLKPLCHLLASKWMHIRSIWASRQNNIQILIF